MPVERYDAFFDKCRPSGPELSILQRGMLVRRPHDGHYARTMQIDCDVIHARRLLELARQIYPEAIPDIEHALAAPRDS